MWRLASCSKVSYFVRYADYVYFYKITLRDEAEGFCYINDIGIALQKLRDRFQRILYIDLDVHHGMFKIFENEFSSKKI